MPLTLKLILTAPLIVLVFTIFVDFVARHANLKKEGTSELFKRTFLYGLIGAGGTLLYTILWMIWYEISTGYGAGNGPLEWIFFLGPLSMAAGQILGIIVWGFKKPRRDHD